MAATPVNAKNVLELIGNTPMLKVSKIDTGKCELFLKLENQNPGGSIKDRIALSMIAAAERDSKLKPGGTIVEATAGNTGLGLALIASQKAYKIILVIPDKMSQEKIFHLKALGAEIIMTRSDVNKGHPEYYQDMAQRIAKETGGFYVNQFGNPANPLAHEKTTGPEIWEQMQHKIDAIVCGVGSGGTLTGLGRYFSKTSPNVEMILADPKGSVLAPFLKTGKMIEAGNWLVEGIGEDFIPDNCEMKFIKDAYSITDAESIATSREVLIKEGIMCGSSSGTLIAAALKYCRSQKEPKRVVSFVCDSGNKYLSKVYNEYWLEDYGFTDRVEKHDLTDLISRPYGKGSAIVIRPEDTLQKAYRKMKTYDVSQLPVINGDRILGIVDESDILMAAMGNPAGFNIKASEAMAKNLVTLDIKSPIDKLLPIFDKGMVAIITDNDKFVGIVTKIDLLQHLRKRSAK